MRRLNLTHTVNKKHPLNRGLISWWLALPQGPRGGIFRDLMRRNHGTLTNGPTWGGALGRPGGWGSLDFDGTDDYVQITQVQFTGAFTVACWVYPRSMSAFEDTGGLHALVNNGTSQEQLAIGTGELAVTIFNSLSRLFPGSNNFTNDSWQHFCFTRDASDICQFYRNGLTVDSPFSKGGTFTIDRWGYDPVAGSSRVPFNGRKDDKRLYSRGLSAAETAALYHASRQGYLNWIRRAKSTLRAQEIASQSKIGHFVHAPWQPPYESGAWR